MLLSPESIRRLCEARAKLSELQEHPPSVRQLAAHAELSHFHFIRQFKAVFGVPPHELRIRSRIDHAKRLLAQTSFP